MPSEEPLHIIVHSTPTPYTLYVTWTPLHPVAGQSVVFTATLDPPNPAIAKGPYYFSFGGKSKLESPRNIYSQPFGKPGTYPVHARLPVEHGHTIESLPAELIVMPVPPSCWERWGKFAVPATAIVLSASFLGFYGISKHLTGLVAFRAMGRIGSVHLHQDGKDGLEAVFGFRLEQPPAAPTAEFRGPVVAKVERIR